MELDVFDVRNDNLTQTQTFYPLANHYFPFLCEIRLKLLEFKSSENALIFELGNVMKNFFDEYWEQINTLLSITSIFDPYMLQDNRFCHFFIL